jgi:hypothetical protein
VQEGLFQCIAFEINCSRHYNVSAATRLTAAGLICSKNGGRSADGTTSNDTGSFGDEPGSNKRFAPHSKRVKVERT